MKLPKGTNVYAAYVAGVLSAVALAWVLWRTQVPSPPEQ